MFEGAFEKLGIISTKHSGKVVIFWIVLLVILSPFASLLFSQTSYDLGNSITPQNSMATVADNLQSTYFGVNSTGSGSNDTLVIVTTGTSMNQNSAVSALLTSQYSVKAYLARNGVSSNFTSILNVENSTLSGVASFAVAILNASYPLVAELNNQSYQVNGTLNALSGIIFGAPANYLSNYSQSYSSTLNDAKSRDMAFNSTSAYLASFLPASLLPIGYLYLNTFTGYLAYYGVTVANVSSAITQTIMSSNSYYASTLLSDPSTSPLYNMSVAIDQNFTFATFLSASLGFPALFNSNFTENYTVGSISTGLMQNSSIAGLLNNELNISARQLVTFAFSLGEFPSNYALQTLTDNIVRNATVQYFYGSPLITINTNTILSFVKYVNTTLNANISAYQTLLDGDFATYPAVPAGYVYHQFVGYDNSTVITILTTNANITSAQTDSIGQTYDSNLAPLGNTSYYMAGSSALSNQLASESLSGMVKALVIGIVLSVIIVGIFFRSPVAAFLPLAVFGMSAAISLSLNALLYKYILHASISFITPTLLLILLLGLSSDYVVYIMARYRKELRKGNPDASSVTSRWAGHAVFTSGITVGLSYIVLWLSGVPIFSDSGITNAIGVIITILIANTFLIAVLSRGKGKIFWPYKITNGQHLPGEKGMHKVADFVVKNKGKILVIFLLSTLLGTYVYAITPTNMDVFKLVPSSSGIQAMEVVNSSFHGDFFDRGFIILEFSSPVVQGSSYNMSEVRVITAVENTLLNSSQVTQVYGPTFPYGYYQNITLDSVPARYQSSYTDQINSYIGNDSRYVVIDFQLQTLAYESGPSQFVKNLPAYLSNDTATVKEVYIGGLTESLNDSYSFTANTFVKMVPILVIAIFAVLLIQISSLFTPIRLILMVFASVIVSLALAYLALHFYAGLPILIFLPMFTVITLLAVGLDYDIFMVARVREEVYKGRTDEEGIRTSIIENGGVIITLGTLLFATFGSLAFSGIGIIQEIGVGLGLGVLIDTFVSWPFFVPAVMLYLQRYNWWPSKLSRNQESEKKE